MAVIMVMMTGVAVLTMMIAMNGKRSNHGESRGGWKGQAGGMI